MTHKKKKIVVLELNEFNAQLMKELADKMGLENLKKLLGFSKGVTFTEDEYESGYLEPWVQWVNVHTGVPSSDHRIKHLGDVPHLRFKQLWEKLSDEGCTSIVWGAMNATRGRAPNCLYFLPDPWTFSEPGYPNEADQLLELPRYLAKNYLLLETKTVFKKIMRMLQVFDYSIFFSFDGIRELGRLMWNVLKRGPKNFLFISYFDFISVKMFLNKKKALNPDVSFLFLNSLAHIQHHYWSATYKRNLEYGYRVMNNTIGLMLDQLRHDEIIVINALTQKNTNEEKPWILYRQNNPKEFFLSLGLGIIAVEQLMTHDSHLHFNSASDRDHAFHVLSHTKIEGAKLFHCEKNSEDERSLFIRLDFFDAITNDPVTVINGKTIRFMEQFTAIVTRTGKHVPKGDIFVKESIAPTRIPNHKIHDYIFDLARR